MYKKEAKMEGCEYFYSTTPKRALIQEPSKQGLLEDYCLYAMICVLQLFQHRNKMKSLYRITQRTGISVACPVFYNHECKSV